MEQLDKKGLHLSVNAMPTFDALAGEATTSIGLIGLRGCLWRTVCSAITSGLRRWFSGRPISSGRCKIGYSLGFLSSLNKVTTQLSPNQENSPHAASLLLAPHEEEVKPGTENGINNVFLLIGPAMVGRRLPLKSRWSVNMRCSEDP
ncbi:MAG: hypothetical protein ACJ788_09690 [Ktedonobacteraceae bacterium]